MTNAQFLTSMYLVGNSLIGELFEAIKGERLDDHIRLTIDLKDGAARDLVEMRLKTHLASYFYSVQVLAIAFIGRGADQKVLIFLVDQEVTGAQVSKVRQIIQDTDSRALVSYPVRARV